MRAPARTVIGPCSQGRGFFRRAPGMWPLPDPVGATKLILISFVICDSVRSRWAVLGSGSVLRSFGRAASFRGGSSPPLGDVVGDAPILLRPWVQAPQARPARRRVTRSPLELAKGRQATDWT